MLGTNSIAPNILINAINKSKMEKKQSSVEWLEQQLNAILKQSNIEIENVIWQQAKTMHKEEVTDAYIECWMNDGGNGFHKVKEAEQYYNETFGGENEQ